MPGMSRRAIALLFVGLLCLLAVSCNPKTSMDEAPSDPPPMQEGIEPLESRAEAAPKVGDHFPDVTIVDDTGEPVNIRTLAGKKPYTVLTLGCLT